MHAKIIAPAITVFNRDGKPDYEANKAVIDFMLQNGVDGILVLGSAGEFTALDPAEKRRFLEFYAAYAGGRTALYAGTGSDRYEDTLALSNRACQIGYAAAMVIGPYYFGMSQQQIFTYYDALAKHLSGDLMIYNYPARSGYSVAAQTVQRLVQANPNIIGLKDTVSEPAHTSQVCRATAGTGFQVYSGYDDQFLYNLSCGGAGSFGGLANVIPDIWSDLIRAVRRDDYTRALRLTPMLHKLIHVYETDTSSAYLLKAMLVRRGLDISPRAIFPFVQPDGADVARMEQLLQEVLDEYRTLPPEPRGN
ncbi:MAG TPA: dihydrodipicolinate synthase family protein [Candidatus Butyricicoccus stercorigallinarum]|nr:dihydrodipicolinate synthase family protein [Candidatus Butyricicoccus stercorigallinarum]